MTLFLKPLLFYLYGFLNPVDGRKKQKQAHFKSDVHSLWVFTFIFDEVRSIWLKLPAMYGAQLGLLHSTYCEGLSFLRASCCQAWVSILDSQCQCLCEIFSIELPCWSEAVELNWTQTLFCVIAW